MLLLYDSLLELCLKGVCPAAKVLAQFGNIQTGNFLCRNGLTYADINHSTTFVQGFPGKHHRAQAGMDAAQAVEQLGILTVKIDRNHRQSATLDQLDHGLCPGNIFNNAFIAKGRAFAALLPCAHLTGWEHSQWNAGGDMSHGLADAVETAGRA